MNRRAFTHISLAYTLRRAREQRSARQIDRSRYCLDACARGAWHTSALSNVDGAAVALANQAPAAREQNSTFVRSAIER